MAPPERELLRKLADWPGNGYPVTSLYLDVDGRRRPRRADVERVAESLLRRAVEGARSLDRDASRSVSGDAQRMRDFLHDEFDRKGVRGLAIFSSHGAGRWEEVPLPQPIRDRAAVRPRPYVLPLEALLEKAETFCTVLIDREKARIMVSTLGEIEEVTSVLDEVPGQHDQGGWAQARLQRHVEDHVLRHLKRVAQALLRLHQRRRFHRLVLSGPDEVVAELERELHDYVRRTLVDRASLPMGSAVADVLRYTLALEERLEADREAETVRRLRGETAARSGRAAVGLAPTLAVLEAGRVETLVVTLGLTATGVRCPACGHLDLSGDSCPVCGKTMEEEPDLVEEAVEAALRRGCRVETIPSPGELETFGGIGALLRF
jgi:peptide chain release factor subunit 1